MSLRSQVADHGRSTFHDAIQGTTHWPTLYDGRAIITNSYKEHNSGLSLEENKSRFSAANSAGDSSRQVAWS